MDGWRELVTVLGPSGGGVIITLLFLRYLSQRDAAAEEREKAVLAALNKNTTALGKLLGRLGVTEEALNDITPRIDRHSSDLRTLNKDHADRVARRKAEMRDRGAGGVQPDQHRP